MKLTVYGKRACQCQLDTLKILEPRLRAAGAIKTDLSGLITQGAYSTSVGASAGTHTGGGVWDVKHALVATDVLKRVWWECGVIPFDRRTSDGRWVAHGHVVWIGCVHRHSSAVRQEGQARAGRNALANNGVFRGFKPSRVVTWKDALRVAGPAPSPGWDGRSFPGGAAFELGSTHPAVKVLGERLVVHGFGGRYKVGPGAPMSVVDRLSTQDFQRAQGWSGSDADGFAGPSTWGRLMASPAPPVAPPAPPVALANVWAAFGAWNLLNPDLASSALAGVPRNADKQGAWLKAKVKASVYMVCEAGRGELEKLVKALGPSWQFSEHPNGCVAVVYDTAKWEAKAPRSLWFGNKDRFRGAHCVPLVHRASSVGVDVIALHVLPSNAGGTDEVKRRDIRAAAGLAGSWPAVLGGDFNTSWVQGVGALSGWELATPRGADTSTSAGVQALDAIFTSGLHGVRAGAVVDADGLSDHHAVRATVRLDRPVVSPV